MRGVQQQPSADDASTEPVRTGEAVLAQGRTYGQGEAEHDRSDADPQRQGYAAEETGPGDEQEADNDEAGIEEPWLLVGGGAEQVVDEVIELVACARPLCLVLPEEPRTARNDDHPARAAGVRLVDRGG